MFVPSRTLGLALAVSLISVPVSAQLGTMIEMAPSDALAQLDLGYGTAQTLELPQAVTGNTVFDVEIDGVTRTLEVWPHSMRSSDFQLLTDESGELAPVAAPAITTFRGVVSEFPESVVAGSLVDGKMTATILLVQGAPMWGIQAVEGLDGEHVVYDAGDNLAQDTTCGVADSDHRDHDHDDRDAPQILLGQVQKVCEIGIDSDVEFYNKNGNSVAATENDIENIMNAVEAIYDSQFGILYEITTIIVRTQETDPYSSTSSGTLLNQFQNHWNSSQGSVQRDVAHLFTGKNINGGTIGIAYLNVICNIGSAYGLSESRYTNNFNNRVALTAHELGHNWAAGHCNGTSDCKIMCSSLGGCGAVTSFGNQASNSIQNKKNSSGCLSDPPAGVPPTITNISPNSSMVLSGETITVLGSDLNGISSIDVGGVSITGSAINVVNSTEVTFSTPIPTALGNSTLTATNNAGTSNGQSFSIVAQVPPKLTATGFALTSNDFEWTYGAGAGDTAYLNISLGQQTFPYQGYNILLNFTTLLAGPLGANGVQELSFPIPASASGLNVRSQVVVFSPNFDGASNITSTLIF